MRHIFFFFSSIFFLFGACYGHDVMTLKENLRKGNAGDFIVTSQGKNYTLLHIFAKQNDMLTIEEITVPANHISAQTNWKEWVYQKAPGNTGWVLYRLNFSSGEIQDCFSVTQNAWLDLSKGNRFLFTLLNIHLLRLSDKERKKIGESSHVGPDRRPIWHPKMILEGKFIPNVAFSAWRTRWPNDNTPLSGKMIDVYVPEENEKYPSYFPYWLEVRGTAGGKVTVRIIDSGSKMRSPIVLEPIS